MKRITFFTVVAVAVVALMFTIDGCSSGGSGGGDKTVSGPSSGSTGTSTGTGTGGNGGGGTPGTPGTNDAGTGMSAVQDMFNYVNSSRQTYASHGGYGDYPWEAGHNNGMQNIIPWTWPVSMTWDQGLADEAQQLADAIAAGGSPFGRKFNFQNSTTKEAFWADGLDTAKYRICAQSLDSSTEDSRWFSHSNGTAREGIFYQTGMALTAHDCKTKLGVGKADVGANDIWWVLIFGE
jgi:hypothetical protein